MKYIVCAIRDSALDAFGVPMFMASKGQAIRSFSDECNRPESAIAKHPSDFELFFLGTFVDEDADFDCGGPPVSLIRAVDCVKLLVETSRK